MKSLTAFHRTTALVTLLLLAAVASPATSAAASRQRPGDSRIPGRYIVVYKKAVESVKAETDQRERKKGFKSDLRYARALKGFAARLSARQVRELEGDPEVAFVSPDRTVHAVGSVPLAAGEPLPPTGVRRMEAATATTTRESSPANVAVIDTGVDLAHPDLNAVDGKNCVGGATAQDDNGHGTHVAGTIAAKNNGGGVVGVAPGTRTYAAKVLDSRGSGTTSQVICGIDWVTANAAALNIKVANMSLGGVGQPVEPCATTSDPQHKAICNSVAAGVTYVVAAGNDGWDFDYAPQPDTPAAYPEVLTVTAVSDSDGQAGAAGGSPACRTSESDDRYAGFSNYAATTAGADHSIAGPGVCINSTWPGGGYNTISGTSMATPHLAGAAALCLGEGTESGPCAGLTPAQIVQKMRTDADGHSAADNGYGYTGDPLRPVSGRYYGYLDWSGIPAPPPEPAAPTATTGSAGSITTTSATVNGKVNPGSQETTYRFEYGTTTAYGQASAEPSVSGSTDQAVSASLTGLTPGTTYHYRLVATNASGTSVGADATFTTAARVTAAPSSTTIEIGSLRGGGAAALAADDTAYYSVNSNTKSTRTASWYGTFAAVPRTLSNLRVTYKGKDSRSCSQTVAIYRYADGKWLTLDSRSVGTSEVLIPNLAPSGAPSDYLSSSGNLHVRVRCATSSGTFFASGNLLQIAYDK